MPEKNGGSAVPSLHDFLSVDEIRHCRDALIQYEKSLLRAALKPGQAPGVSAEFYKVRRGVAELARKFYLST